MPGCSRPLLLVIANACLLSTLLLVIANAWALSTSPSCHCECLGALDLSFLSLRMPVCSRPLLLVIANAWVLSTGMKQSLNTHTSQPRLLRRFLVSHTTVTDRSAPLNDKSRMCHSLQPIQLSTTSNLSALDLSSLSLRIPGCSCPLLLVIANAWVLSTSPSCHCECLGALDRHEAIS
jgi:hypothetical protein